MGTFTTTRVVPKERRLRGRFSVNGVPQGVGVTPFNPYVYGDDMMGGYPMETTTSFRTGARADAMATNIELSGGGSWADAVSAISEDSQNESSDLRIGDNGHNFETTKTRVVYCTRGERSAKIQPSGSVHSYSGHLVPVSTNGWPGFGSGGGGINFTNYSAKAINSTIPTSSDADLAVTLAEIRREGLPHISTSGGVAGNYLGFEFGWKPFKAELEALLEATISWRQKLEQYHRDSMKTVRRSYVFPTESNWEDMTNHRAGYIACVSSSTSARDVMFRKSNGIVDYTASWFRTTRQTTRRVWFEGAYTYNLNPNVGGFLDKVYRLESDIRYMLGVKADAEVVWNLTPWSWFVDWNSSIGNVIGNAEAFSRDGCVLKYGYLMAHSSVVLEMTALNWNGVYRAKFLKETKQRVRANPYGFALSTSAYTDRQWAILAALGMTRAPKVLKFLS